MNHVKSILLSFLFLLLLPALCFADTGLPMIIVGMPYLILLLIPIIFIESYVFQKELKLGYKRLFKAVGLANIASTLAGYPLSWIILFGVELLTTGLYAFFIGSRSPHYNRFWETILNIIGFVLSAAWLIPWNIETEGYWMIPLAMSIGLIPAYYISVYMESRVIQKYFREDYETFQKIKPICRKANMYSYLFLIIVLGITVISHYL